MPQLIDELFVSGQRMRHHVEHGMCPFVAEGLL
jgi:hypothetical protein